MRPLVHAGNIGVRLFFVISGFLITALLLREFDAHGAVSLKNFYIRRSLRILPAFVFYIVVIQILATLHVIDSPWVDAKYALTFTLNYHDSRSWPLNHLWSLSVEEQFYLIWGILFVTLSPRSMRVVVLALAIIPLGIRSFYVLAHPVWVTETALARHFECVCDALAAGALLAIYFNRLEASPLASFARSGWLLGMGTALTALAASSYLANADAYYSVGQTVANAGLAMVVWYSVAGNGGYVTRLLNWRPLVFLGLLSYSLYLWQELFLNPFVRSWYTTLPWSIVFAFIAALASYRLVELPFLRARRFFPAA
jgi:peptidoglycan/LPS O-acetylase OafA/YrhL